MKTAIIIALFAFATADPTDYYITDNTGLNIEALSPFNLKSYMDCYLDKGPCSKVAASYKKYIAEAVAQSCKRSSPDQKKFFWRFLEITKTLLPIEYWHFWKKYDPKHKYYGPLMKELNKYKINAHLPLPITTDIPAI